jgi:hypothetical protein
VTGILAAAVVSAVVGAATWWLTILVARLLPSGFSILYVLPFLTAPLLGGFAGGLVSRRFVGLVGSLAGGVVALPILAVVVLGWTLSLNGLLQAAVVIGVLGTAGHLTGVIVRPTRMSSGVTP